MPRFFFDTYNGFVDIDDVGQELADNEAVRQEVRGTLPAMLREGITGRDKSQFRVDVRNEHGKRVVTASALMIIDCVDDPGSAA